MRNVYYGIKHHSIALTIQDEIGKVIHEPFKHMVVQAMKQETFTDIEYSCRKKKTKREEFLEIMDEIIPWDEWVGVIRPCYPEGKRGRPPMGIEKMLRMYLLQIWFNLSDPATEDAIYDSYAMRKFTGIDFMTEAVPDETTLCKFRHLLEENEIGRAHV